MICCHGSFVQPQVNHPRPFSEDSRQAFPYRSLQEEIVSVAYQLMENSRYTDPFIRPLLLLGRVSRIFDPVRISWDWARLFQNREQSRLRVLEGLIMS